MSSSLRLVFMSLVLAVAGASRVVAHALSILFHETSGNATSPVVNGDVMAKLGATIGAAHSREATTFVQALLQSFTLMCAAEIFDRTWFVALICSIHYGAVLSFVASFSALAIHSVMAIAFGAGVASFLPKWALQLLSALVLGTFAVIYAWECFQADSSKDALKSRKEEAQGDACATNPQEAAVAADGASATDSVGGTKFKAPSMTWPAFASVFATIFIAEWGDKTQIAQITLAASLPWLPVLLGSLVAFMLLCLSAVVLSKFLEGREISERVLNAICAAAFCIMACIALHNAAREGLVAKS